MLDRHRRRPAAGRRGKAALASLAALALTAGLLAGGPAAANAADLTDGLTLWYKLDATAGTVATDASGNGRHGTVHGTADWSGDNGLGLNGSNTYVGLPNDVLRGLDSITVAMDVFIAPAQATPYFIYGMGNTSSGTGNGYLFATGDQFRTAIASGNWSTEQNTRPAATRNLARGVWKHVTYTQTGTTGVLYEDGVEVGRNTAVTITPGSIGAGTTTANYIGRSVYTSDRYLNGRVRDFRIYDRAVTATEAAELGRPAATGVVARDKATLDLGDTSGVTTALALPVTGAAGSTITWTSSDPDLVSTDGTVTRPALGQPDATATLTATLARGSVSDTKTFDVTVLAQFDDARIVAAAAAALTVHNVDDVRGNLTLPTTGADATAVNWASSRPSVIATDGEVNRPAHGTADTTVTLTATVTRNAASATRTFTATVPQLPAPADRTGYLFSYFTGEGTANGEQVYYALSEGNDPLRWRELNDSQPVLTSTLGEKGLRDPFIIRSPEGDKFYQIATDLRIHGNGNWDGAQRTGSKSIMVWESTDLVNWTDQRLVKVSPDTAGNTWAPETYYDPTIGAYVVFWASKLYAADDPDHTGNTYNKMMYATTRDFHTFSEPQVWVDPGYSVIDSTVIDHDGVYYRYTKDERNNSSSTPCSKFILAETSTSLRDTGWDFLADCIGRGAMSQGEGPTIFKSNTEEKWYLFIDEFGGRGYIPFETTDLTSGAWTPSADYDLPSSPRHGTVLPVTQTEYDALLAAYGPDPEPEPTDGLLLHYEFDETSGTVAADSSGQGRHGTYERTPAFGTGVHGGSVKLSGGTNTSTTAPYVTIPNGVFAGVASTTVATWVKWDSSSTANQWIYGLGADSNRYLFSTPRSGGGVLFSAITTGSWQAEKQLRASSALTGGEWKHLAVTVDSVTRTAVMYLDGVAIARATDVTVRPADLHNAAGSDAGYIGRSLYAADPYFAGEVDDFRIYGRALDADEVYALGGDPAAITGATLPQLKVDAIIDAERRRVILPVRPDSDLRTLAPQLTLAPGATVSPASGTVRDLTAPVTYTVTGADGTTATWTVEARLMRSPVLPGLYADPNIAVFGDRFYLYATTDGFAGWSGTKFSVFSSANLVDWTDHGVILDLETDISWADNSAWAPTIAERDGKWYFYFSGGKATGDTGKHLGVAVADSPTGPFRDALGEPLVPAGTYAGQMIDPAVFTDDDGRSYLYWGNGNAYQVELNDDMVSFDPAKVTSHRPAGYNEGAFVIKRDGRYYFMWSENDTRSEDYQVAYAVGDSPLGPWSERRGTILRKDLSLGIKGTGHHSVVRVPGTDDWYIAYHRFAIPDGDGTHRETTIDRLEFAADGSIVPVVPTLESITPIRPVNTAPVVIAVTGPVGPVAAGAEVSVTATFSDNGADDTHRCVVVWGDGATGTGTIDGSACVAGHTYAEPGVYRPTVTVIDDRGAAHTLAAGYLAVRRADGGYVAGSGRFTSPAGAYPADPALAGRAEFGFVAATDPGVTGPGAVALRLRVGEWEFAATSHRGYVVDGPQVRFNGRGTVNGAGDYTYMVGLNDEALREQGKDRFWVRIVDTATGTVVYDSRTNAGTTALDGGAVVVDLP
ncbi:family 43 glycosylhydrolase [Micromonospora sp. NBC_01813]|uniref:family 43 glycosylhydrolase n=1 Tax=Micromonospora sp. NBC_01813 TaxID=2975988 RepID=UPI002DDB1D66|nr:family 43 glycosylhydrolase [Micromonospora sp. NBC_01813]WSA11396.1 family 43 glycosylhydrolase [Micromonospora sp. NBC_01813]